MEGNLPGYRSEDRNFLLIAIVILVVAVVFFSYQISVLFVADGIDRDDSEKEKTPQDVNKQIESTKNAFESIGSELDEISELI